MEDVEPARPVAPTTARGGRVSYPVWWFGLGASALVAGVLSLSAYADGLPAVLHRVRHADKVIHFSICGALAFFLDGALRRRALRVGRVAIPLAAVLILVPAAIEESLQRYAVHRTSSVGDFVADALGVACFVWLSRRLDGRR